MNRTLPILCLTMLNCALLTPSNPAVAAEAANAVGRLTFLSMETSDELGGVVDLTISKDGRFLYAAAFHASTIGVYSRDTNTGEISPVQFVKGLSGISGVIAFRLSPDQRHAVAAGMRSQAVALFKRDPETGELDVLHVARKRDGVQGLGFPVRAKFSPDGKHVYALDGGKGGITAFRFDPATGLEWLQTFTDSSMAGGSRALTILPDGRTIVAVNYRAHSLAVVNRDPATGKLALRQAVIDGENGAEQIDGPFGITSTADGRFVYVCSGRFTGDNAVSAFRVTNERNLEAIGAVAHGDDDLQFVGGNEVIVTADGKNAYGTATRSGTLACFARDTQSGKLRLIQSIVNDKRTVRLDGPAGLECSPDGRFVYVPVEWQKSIAIYRRETAQ